MVARCIISRRLRTQQIISDSSNCFTASCKLTHSVLAREQLSVKSSQQQLEVVLGILKVEAKRY